MSAATEKNPENLKIAAGASKPPVGIVPLHPLLGMARVLEDSSVKYAPFNYMVQSVAEACESYTSAELRHHIQSTLLGGQVTPESLAAIDEDSGLPHIFHRITGLFILATLMIRDGIIPADPGVGKRKRASMCPGADGAECPAPEPLYDEPCDGCPGVNKGACCRNLESVPEDMRDSEAAAAAAWREHYARTTVSATPNGDGTYTVQTTAGIVGDVLVPGSVVVLDEQNMAKLKLDTSDPHTKAVYEACQQAAREVASWPAWKRGVDPDAARRAQCEREMAERAKSLKPSVQPMTNHHEEG